MKEERTPIYQQGLGETGELRSKSLACPCAALAPLVGGENNEQEASTVSL